MSPVSKREYLEAIFLRYKRASRQLKTIILNEFCTTCGYHRKHAIRQLRKFKRFIKPKVKKRGRRPVYDKETILKPLKCIWLAANLPCSKRLKVILPLWMPGYTQIYGEPPKEVVNALLAISPATIDRFLKPVRVRYKGRGRATTKPGTLSRKQIPIKTNQWDETRPGFLEADTVAHCGEALYHHIADYNPLFHSFFCKQQRDLVLRFNITDNLVKHGFQYLHYIVFSQRLKHCLPRYICADDFRDVLNSHGFIQSMSRAGNVYCYRE